MNKPEDDTKVCPFCAETIKAAAIMCRFCHSDLTPVQGVNEPASPPETGQPAPPVVLEKAPIGQPEPQAADQKYAAQGRSAPPRDHARRARVVVVGAVVASLLATMVFTVLGFLSWRDNRDLAAAQDAGRTVRATLPGNLETLLSYSYKTFADDRAAAEKLLTPSFREEYLPTVAAIEDGATEQRRTQEATVVAVAVVSQTPEEIHALVFLNRLTYTKGSDKQRILQDRANVTVTRSERGSWLINEISFPA